MERLDHKVSPTAAPLDSDRAVIAALRSGLGTSGGRSVDLGCTQTIVLVLIVQYIHRLYNTRTEGVVIKEKVARRSGTCHEGAVSWIYLPML